MQLPGGKKWSQLLKKNKKQKCVNNLIENVNKNDYFLN